MSDKVNYHLMRIKLCKLRSIELTFIENVLVY